MAYDQDMELVERVRIELAGLNVEERKMFGGLIFMLNGKLAIAVRDHQLLVHVDRDEYSNFMKEPGTHPREHKGRQPAIGVVLIDAEHVADKASLRTWIDRAIAHNTALINAK